jgi:hypothetical protein
MGSLRDRGLVIGFARRLKGDLPPQHAIAPILHRHQIGRALRDVDDRDD